MEINLVIIKPLHLNDYGLMITKLKNKVFYPL